MKVDNTGLVGITYRINRRVDIIFAVYEGGRRRVIARLVKYNKWGHRAAGPHVDDLARVIASNLDSAFMGELL